MGNWWKEEFNPLNPLDLLAGFGYALDTPWAMARNTMAGENPAMGLFDPQERTSGRELLESWNVLGENKPGLDVGDVAGFGVEMLDPLAWAGGMWGTKAIRGLRAGRAATKAARTPKQVTDLVPMAGRPMPQGGALVPMGQEAATAARRVPWYHASPAPIEELNKGFSPRPGIGWEEPSGVWFTADKTASGTGRAAFPTTEWRARPRKTIAKNSEEYHELSKSADDATLAAHADLLEGLFSEREDQLHFLEEALRSNDPTHAGNILTRLLRERGYDSVRATAGDDDWLIALDPAIIARPGQTAKKRISSPEIPAPSPVQQLLPSPTPMFYSRTREAIEQLPKRITASPTQTSRAIPAREVFNKKTGKMMKIPGRPAKVTKPARTLEEQVIGPLKEYEVRAVVDDVEQVIQGGFQSPKDAKTWMRKEGKAGTIHPGGPLLEEAEWMRLPALLKGKKSVSKKELLEHVDANAIQVEEKVLGGGQRSVLQNRFNELDVQRQQLQQKYNTYLREGKHDEAIALRQEFEPMGVELSNLSHKIRTLDEPPPPHYADSTYQVPGGQNYRELLLKMPESSTPRATVSFESFKATRPHLDDDTLRSLYEDVLSGSMRDVEGSLRKGSYQSPHWDDPNVLAHVIFDERVGPKGEKTLFIQEIQSDWHQAGRESGYKGRDKLSAQLDRDATTERARFAPGVLSPNVYNVKRGSDVVGQFAGATPEDAIRAVQVQAVPDAPFKESRWADLSLKRMLKWAGDNGYERIAITNGDLAARYAAGGVTDKKTVAGLKKWYDEVLPNKLAKLLKSEKVKMEPMDLTRVRFDVPGEPVASYPQNIVASFRVPQAAKKRISRRGQPLLSMLPFGIAGGLGAGAANQFEPVESY